VRRPAADRLRPRHGALHCHEAGHHALRRPEARHLRPPQEGFPLAPRSLSTFPVTQCGSLCFCDAAGSCSPWVSRIRLAPPLASRHLADLAGRLPAQDLGGSALSPIRLDLMGNPADVIVIHGCAFACVWVKRLSERCGPEHSCCLDPLFCWFL